VRFVHRESGFLPRRPRYILSRDLQMSTSSSLRGFAGRTLRQPPLMHGIALSLFRPLWVCAAIIIIAGPTVILRAFDIKSTSFAARLALAWGIGFLLYVGRFGTYALQFWKIRYVNPRFSIMTLRPFGNTATSLLFRDLVAPILGCYGDLRVISDEAYDGASKKTDDQTLDFQQLGDVRLAEKLSDQDWRSGVLLLILQSDVAVIDLTMPSLNVLWEAARCIAFLPPHRVFLIGVRGIPWERTMALVRDYLEDYRLQFADDLPPGTSSLDPPKPISYGGWFRSMQFRLQIFRRMQAIARLDQDLTVASRWRPPKATVSRCPHCGEAPADIHLVDPGNFQCQACGKEFPPEQLKCSERVETGDAGESNEPEESH